MTWCFQPVIAGGLVLFGSSADDKVVALDLAHGAAAVEFLHWRAGAVCSGGLARPRCWSPVTTVSCMPWHWRMERNCGDTVAGPNPRRLLGNERMISRWPARGGPVVIDDTVYYAAGIWPSDGVYLHALKAKTGEVVWTNDTSGSIEMGQPHGGAMAKSGVAPQGYLAASQERLFVPTGRAVPARVRPGDGRVSVLPSAGESLDRWRASLPCRPIPGQRRLPVLIRRPGVWRLAAGGAC